MSLPVALRATARRFPGTVAFRTLNGETSYTWAEVVEEVDRLAAGLADLGVRKGTSVAVMMRNRPEYMLADLAVVSNGAAGFGLYATLPPEQIAHQLRNSGASVIVCEPRFLEAITAARRQVPQVEHVVVLDEHDHPGTRSWSSVLAAGDECRGGWTPDDADLDDIATLIYTSGTTGPSKGVELSHRNILASVNAVNSVLGLAAGNRVISWLPNAHVAERLAHYYLPVCTGVSVTCCDDPGAIFGALPRVEPHWFFAVPRVWEKLRSAIDARVSAMPDASRAEVRAALERRLERVRAGEQEPVGAAHGSSELDEDLTVLAPLRVGLGLHVALNLQAGAAPCPRDVVEFFHALGLPLTEIWGMSETTAAGTMSAPDRYRIGTVGTAHPGVDLCLADDGEVLVRGPVVTRGYRGEPEKTVEAFKDGWFCTGDVGTIDADGFVTIIDRKKELIINAAGKNMSPTNIESAIRAASPLVGQAVAIGDRRKFNVALIVLEPEASATFAAQHGIGDASVSTLAKDPTVHAEIERAIAEANGRLARVEQIKKFAILPDAWEPGSTELTPTMKLRRKPISDRYADVIERLYVDDRTATPTS